METAEQDVMGAGGSAQKEEHRGDGQAEQTEQQVKRVQAECNGMADRLEETAVATVQHQHSQVPAHTQQQLQ